MEYLGFFHLLLTSQACIHILTCLNISRVELQMNVYNFPVPSHESERPCMTYIFVLGVYVSFLFSVSFYHV